MSSAPSTRELREKLAEELAAAANLRWRLQGLVAGAAAHALAAMVSELERPTLVVAASSTAADDFALELETVLGEKPGDSFLAKRVHPFPAREAPPLEMISPTLEIEAARSAALYQITHMRRPIVVTSVAAIMQRTESRDALAASALYLVAGDDLDLDAFQARLTAMGYRRTGLVEEPGETAGRGGIVDVWPAGAEYPCRIELYGDMIESLRTFDPVDQRSFGEVEELAVLPAGSCAADVLGDAELRRIVHERCNDLMLPAGVRRELDANLAAAARFPGVELLACYLSEHRAWLGQYLPPEGLLVVLDPPSVEAALEDLCNDIEHAREAATDAGTFFPEPELLYVERPALADFLSRRPLLELDLTEAVESTGVAGDRVWRIEARTNESISAARARVAAKHGEQRFTPMAEELSKLSAGARVIVLASDATQLERLRHLLEISGVGRVSIASSYPEALAADPHSLWLVQGRLDRGFRLPADGLAVVTDEEIFGQRRRLVRRRRVSKARALSALAEIEPGDYMVHVDHGIGIYRGLKHLVAGGTEGDYIFLEYAGGDRYYLPVDRINLVEKYTGAGGNPQVAKLGGTTWQRTKQRAKASILEMARELLDLEAFRAVHKRRRFVETGAEFEEFEAHFPFEETDGQKTAIADIVADLTSEKPMDRVVCGDVGYGKTEVAMRGAFLSVMGGKQVAFLVPTTVLARQHYDSLVERFENHPIKIGMLSRFQSRERNERVVEELAAGTLDIIVGTHRLLQHDVRFARLGLLVIDEEHRFGVKAKERIKRMRREIDVLTMTATPIPRTLQLALTGVRDLSLIETPPVDRLAIRTYVARYDEGLIKQSIERELARAGQVFFVHNRVQSIDMVAGRLRDLVPKARIVVAHGQMREGELEKAMLGFLSRDSDVLVCTSIIESGLDISNANTILVNRADTFGLAQLYQIRGRVGRSHRRAYAYLLVPGEKLITEDARRRLAVLQELDDLGSGFRIAAHDMEIRGAGNLLGKQQSGHVAAVGFELFMQMMDEATAELRGQPSGPRVEPEIELGSEAFIPDHYIEDIGERLLVYKRLANVENAAALGGLAEELADRFGPLPHQAEDFIRIMRLRPALKRLAVESLKASKGTVAVRFHEHSPVDRERLVRLVTEHPRLYGLRPGGGFTMSLSGEGWDAMVDEIEKFLDLLEAGLDDGVDGARRKDVEMRYCAMREETVRALARSFAFVVMALPATVATVAAQPIRDLGGARLVNAIVASVDGRPITLRDLELYESGKAKLLPPENRSSREIMLDALVGAMMFDAEFERLGIQASDEDVEQYIDRILEQNGGTREQVTVALERIGLSWSDYFERMRREVQRLALVNREIRSRVNVTPEEVRRYWKDSGEYRTPEEVEVADIYMPFNHDLSAGERQMVERRVQEAYDKVRSDGFGKAAKLYSSGPTADEGGVLGTFRRGSMSLAFERQISKLGAGDISEPFVVDNAYHIMKLVRIVPPDRVPLEEVEEEIREKLYTEHLEERFERWSREDLRKRYHVTLHYEHVSSFL